MNQAQHDELAQLFAQNMHLAQTMQHPQQAPIVEQVPNIAEKSEEHLHFISSHYTPTAHIRPDATSEPSHSPPPPYNESLMPEAMAETLRQHSIDPSALLANQVHLFANADYEQRLRLLELWRIAPPAYPLEAHLAGSKWAPTSVEKEEAEARERYEQMMQARVQPPEEHMLDTYVSEPISPIRSAGEPAWPPAARMRAASIAAKMAQPQARYAEAEPYVVNGYEADQRAQSTDPVYAAATGLWQAPSYAHAVQQQQQASSMEDQYGMYQQIRNHADWEAMNERVAREKFAGIHGPVDGMMDDDMEL